MRTCEASRAISMALLISASNAAWPAGASGTAISTIANQPPGRSTRAISRTARRASAMWCRLYAVVTKSNVASSHGSFSALPSNHSIWFRFSFEAASRAFCRMAGVMSSPAICRTCGANTSVKVPGPQATSSARIERIGSAPICARAISKICAASAVRTDWENEANCPAVRVKRSWTRFCCFDSGVLTVSP